MHKRWGWGQQLFQRQQVLSQRGRLPSHKAVTGTKEEEGEEEEEEGSLRRTSVN